MKTSWIIGALMFYLGILFVEMVMTGSAIFAAGVTANQGILTSPTITGTTGVIAQAFTFVSNVKAYLEVLVPMLLLWSPTVFSGVMGWFWWFICFPLDVGLVVSIIWIARGVGSS